MAKKDKKNKPTAEPNLDDLLGALGETVEEKVPAAEKEKPRPTFSASELMTDYAGTVVAAKVLTEHKDIVGAELKDAIWTEFTDLWFSTKARPSNPKVETKKGSRPDCQAIYQCRTNFKVKYREDLSGRAAVIDPLRDLGFSDTKAAQIFDENIEIVVETALRPFNELAQGAWVTGEGGREFQPATDVQKAAAAKLLNFVIGKDAEPLTQVERTECLVKETRYVVKAGFLDRAAHYCTNAAQLRALLTVVEPGEALSSVKFAQNDTDAEKNTRLETLFHDLLHGEAAA